MIILKVNIKNLELLDIYENCNHAADDLEFTYDEIQASLREHKNYNGIQFFEFAYSNPNMHIRKINPVIEYLSKDCNPIRVYCNIAYGYVNCNERVIHYIKNGMWVTGTYGWNILKITDEQKRTLKNIMKYDSLKLNAVKEHRNSKIIALVDVNACSIIAKYSSILSASYEDPLFSIDEINNSIKNLENYNGLQFFEVTCNGKLGCLRIKSNSYPVLEFKDGKFVKLYRSANAAYEETGQYVAKYLSGRLKYENEESYSKWVKIKKCCK